MAARKTVRLGWVIGATALFVAFPTNAQDIDPQAAAMAQSLYEQAIGLMDEKNFAAACPKLEQATKLVPKGLGARLGLGECYVGQRRLASAWAQYVKAEALAAATGEADAAADARAEANKLKPKLAMITITVPETMRGVPGLSVTWDGFVQDEAVWGTPMPIDAGKHKIEAKASARRTWAREVEVPTDGLALEEKVPELEVVPVDVTPPSSEMSRGPTVISRPASRTWMRPVGIAALGVGATALVVGGVLGGIAISKRDASNAEGECNAQNFCNERGVALRDQSLALARGSTAGWLVGGAFVTIGVVLLVSAPHRTKEANASNGVAWQFRVAPGGINAEGVW